MVHEIKHVSAKKIAEDVVIREAKGFTDPAFTNGNLALCENEIAFFKANGFLLKRGFLDEKKAFDRIVDYVWENVPRKIFTREDRQSWVGAPGEQWTEEDSIQVGQIQGSSWKMRSRDGIGPEPFLLDKIASPYARAGGLVHRQARETGETCSWCLRAIPKAAGHRRQPVPARRLHRGPDGRDGVCRRNPPALRWFYGLARIASTSASLLGHGTKWINQL